MDAVVVILFYPYGVQSCGHLRRLCAGHLAACGAKKALDLSLVVYINRAGNESGLLQVDLPALTDVV
jgi:hypothetical protein